MRVLTVQQPWAWAIFHGKGIENRTQLWKYRGPVAIHAGARWSDRGARMVPALLDPDIDLPETAMFGAILGAVDLVDAHHEEGGCCDPWGEQSYVEHGGKVRKQIVHLVLENPVEFAEPIPNVKGALGLWTPDADLADAIGAATRRAAA